MKKITKMMLIVLGTSTIMISGCNKDAAVGPQGSVGPAGLNGSTGTTGPSGATGPTGNANVSTYTYAVPSANWGSNAGGWYALLIDSALTSSNINTAAVDVYFSPGTSGTWFAVPYSAITSIDYFMNFSISTNNVTIWWVYNGGGIGSNPSSFFGVDPIHF